MAVQREVLADELRGVDRRDDVVGAALDRRAAAPAASAAPPRARASRAIRATSVSAPRFSTRERGQRRRRRAAGDARMHEHAGDQVRAAARRAPPPARRPTTCPATNTRLRSIRYFRRTARICAATIAASPQPRAVAGSNQFQQPHAFARGFCRGSSTRQPRSSASAVMRVPCAISSGVCLQPWISTSSGTRRQRAWPRGNVDEVVARAARSTAPSPASRAARTSRPARSGPAPAACAGRAGRRTPWRATRACANMGRHLERPAASRPRAAAAAGATRPRVRSARCRTAPACRSTRPAARSACR